MWIPSVRCYQDKCIFYYSFILNIHFSSFFLFFKLLYGKETSSNLWTERPTPINESVLSLSSTSSSSSTITTLSDCIKNPTSEQSSVTLCNNSDNLTTISTTKVQTTSSQLPSVNTAGLKDKQYELTNPLVDYSYEVNF